jgi:cell wall-associated NlpC family hydrolase
MNSLCASKLGPIKSTLCLTMNRCFVLRADSTLLLLICAGLLVSCASSRPPAEPLGSTAENKPALRHDSSGVVAKTQLSTEQGQSAALYAMGLVGVPYRFGGNTLASGFDCSGFIGHVYQTQTPFAPPRTVAQLNAWGLEVPEDKRRTGDLVFFKPKGVVVPTHAGIYVGQGRFVHAPSTGGTVKLSHTDQPYWARMQVSYRRP